MQSSRRISTSGLDETQSVPQQHKDSASVALRSFDSNFRTINVSLLSIARAVGGLMQKMSNLESNLESNVSSGSDVSLETKPINNNLKKVDARLTKLEESFSSMNVLLKDIYELLKQATTPIDETEETEETEEVEETV